MNKKASGKRLLENDAYFPKGIANSKEFRDVLKDKFPSMVLEMIERDDFIQKGDANGIKLSHRDKDSFYVKYDLDGSRVSLKSDQDNMGILMARHILDDDGVPLTQLSCGSGFMLGNPEKASDEDRTQSVRNITSVLSQNGEVLISQLDKNGVCKMFGLKESEDGAIKFANFPSTENSLAKTASLKKFFLGDDEMGMRSTLTLKELFFGKKTTSTVLKPEPAREI